MRPDKNIIAEDVNESLNGVVIQLTESLGTRLRVDALSHEPVAVLILGHTAEAPAQHLVPTEFIDKSGRYRLYIVVIYIIIIGRIDIHAETAVFIIRGKLNWHAAELEMQLRPKGKYSPAILYKAGKIVIVEHRGVDGENRPTRARKNPGNRGYEQSNGT